MLGVDSKGRLIATISAALFPFATCYTWDYLKYWYKYLKCSRLLQALHEYGSNISTEKNFENYLECYAEMCKTLIAESSIVIEEHSNWDNKKLKETKDKWLSFWIDAKANAHFYLGKAYIVQMKYLDALSEMKSSLYLFSIAGETKISTYIYNEIGLIYQSQGNAYKVLDSFKAALDLLEKYKKNEIKLINQGSGNSKEKDVELLSFYKLEATLNANISLSYSNFEKFSEAIPYLRRSIEIERQYEFNNALLYDLRELSFYYINAQMPNESIQTLEELIEVAKRLGQIDDEIFAYSTLSSVYLSINNFDQSEEMCLHCIRMVKRLKSRGLTFVDEANRELSTIVSNEYPNSPRIKVTDKLSNLIDYLCDIYIKFGKYNESLLVIEIFRFEQHLEDLKEKYENNWKQLSNMSSPSLLKQMEQIEETIKKKYTISDIQRVADECKATLIYYSFRNSLDKKRASQLDIWVIKPDSSHNVYYRGIKLNSENSSNRIDDLMSEVLLEIAVNKKKITEYIESDGFSGKSDNSESSAEISQDEIYHQTIEKYCEENQNHVNTKLNTLFGQLYRIFISPIASLIKEEKNLIIFPHSGISEVPFYAMYNLANQSYLIDHHCISFAESAKKLKINILQQNISRELRMQNSNKYCQYLLVGDPIISFQEDVQNDCLVENLSKILKSNNEAETLLPGHIVVKEKATKSHLYTLLQNGIPKYIHFAVPCSFKKQFQPHIPHEILTGEILLSADKVQTSSNDTLEYLSRLSANEILKLDLYGCGMVTFSLANFGESPPQNSGPIDLSHSFCVAGVPTIVAPLWTIHPSFHSFVFQKLYNSLTEEMPKDEIPSKSQLLREILLCMKNRNKNPAFWAGFFLFGSPV